MSTDADWGWPVAAGKEAVVTGSVTVPAKLTISACGRVFEEALARWMPITVVNGGDKKKKEEEKEPSSPTNSTKGKDPKKKKVTSTKLSDAELEGMHYNLLGLENREWEATDDEIAKAYKKKCLETHPDKTGGDDTVFKAVQIAGDVLTNSAKRKAYDSSLPFDDTIPSLKCPADEFYEEFEPVFKRNSKWYLHGMDKVPSLGNAETPMETVDEFYAFWFSFKTWRDFSHEAAEHDLETAEYREERRWMERENQRKVDKQKKGEMQRILSLVERSYKNDPRIKAREAERIAEKERVREERRFAEEEKKRLEAEEAERKIKEEEEERKNRKANQQKEKKSRQAVRKALKKYDAGEAIDRVHFDWLCAKLSLGELVDLAASIEKVGEDEEELQNLAETLLSDAELKFKETREGKPLDSEKKVEKKEVVIKVKKEVEWSNDELLELQKACTKYPAGTMERWRKLSEAMQDKKTAEQCLKKVKLLEKEYRVPQQQVSGGMKDIGSKTEHLPAATSSKNNAHVNDATWTGEQTRKFKDPVVAEAAPAKAEEKPVVATPKEETNGVAAATEKTVEAEAPEAEAPKEAAVEDFWSASQQKDLENILRDLKSYKDKDKWEKIAEAVEGKSKKQCVSRYKFLCGRIKK